MARYDNRTVSEDQHSFYVFDDLRFQQNPSRLHGKTFDIYYYDTLPEALAKLKSIPAHMTPALGMHRDGRSELDLIHRRNGEYVLVTDYQNISSWRTDPVVKASVDALCNKLSIDWQMDSKLFKSTILLPLERGFHRIPDKGLMDKTLSPEPALFPGNKENPNTAILEVYSPAHGWMSYPQAAKAAEAFGFHDPNLLKIQQFNIRYQDSHGAIGQRDVSPMELQLLKERWQFQSSNLAVKREMAQGIAQELDDFLFSVHGAEHAMGSPDQSSSVARLTSDILSGDIKDILSSLKSISDNSQMSDAVIAKAHFHLSRLTGLVHHTRKPSLSDIIQNADARSSTTSSMQPGKEQSR